MSGEHFATENSTRQMEVVYFITRVIIYFKRQFLAEIKPNEDKHEEIFLKDYICDTMNCYFLLWK